MSDCPGCSGCGCLRVTSKEQCTSSLSVFPQHPCAIQDSLFTENRIFLAKSNFFHLKRYGIQLNVHSDCTACHRAGETRYSFISRVNAVELEVPEARRKPQD